MSAFTDLLRDADRLGVTKCTWECNVAGFTDRPEREGLWTVRATVPRLDIPNGVIETDGRTGEEALRRVVEFLKATQ